MNFIIQVSGTSRYGVKAAKDIVTSLFCANFFRIFFPPRGYIVRAHVFMLVSVPKMDGDFCLFATEGLPATLRILRGTAVVSTVGERTEKKMIRRHRREHRDTETGETDRGTRRHHYSYTYTSGVASGACGLWFFRMTSRGSKAVITVEFRAYCRAQ